MQTLETLLQDCSDKEITVKIKSKELSPEIVAIIDGKEYTGKIIHNEIVWKT